MRVITAKWRRQLLAEVHVCVCVCVCVRVCVHTCIREEEILYLKATCRASQIVLITMKMIYILPGSLSLPLPRAWVRGYILPGSLSLSPAHREPGYEATFYQALSLSPPPTESLGTRLHSTRLSLSPPPTESLGTRLHSTVQAVLFL